MDPNRLIDEAQERPLAADEHTPVDLHLDRRDGLTIKWKDGRTSHYSLVFLRKHCPCATCRTEREQPKPANAGRALTILPANIDRAAQFASAELVGHYAIRIVWADGHSTGIYDFRYLRLIDPMETAPRPEDQRPSG